EAQDDALIGGWKGEGVAGLFELPELIQEPGPHPPDHAGAGDDSEQEQPRDERGPPRANTLLLHRWRRCAPLRRRAHGTFGRIGTRLTRLHGEYPSDRRPARTRPATPQRC